MPKIEIGGPSRRLRCVGTYRRSKLVGQDQRSRPIGFGAKVETLSSPSEKSRKVGQTEGRDG